MHTYTRGFTIFFAALVASLALAIGLAIYDLTIRQLNLASASRDSQYAIFAADTGIECALYWDNKFPTGTNGTASAFATTSTSIVPGNMGLPASGLSCNGQDIAAHGTMPTPYAGQAAQPQSGWTPWTIVFPSSGPTTTTTFSLTYPSPDPRCLTVTVEKGRDGNGFDHTVITSHGYNTCVSGGLQSLERVLQVSY